MITGLERSPGEGNGNPLWHSCLENSMDRGVGQATVHGIPESDMTVRITFTFNNCSGLNFSKISSVQFSSVTQSWLNLCNPMNPSTPGLPVHHQLPEFIQNHVHRVSDAIQPSHPLLSPSPPAPNSSQHQGLLQ